MNRLARKILPLVLPAILLAGFLLLSIGAIAQEPPRASDSFFSNLQALAAAPHRLPGYEDGSRKASRFVEAQLREAGLSEIYIQEFPLVMERSTHCSLEVDGKTHAILPMRPNSLQASITPQEGIEGFTLYAGKGTLEDYGTQNPDGRIVVLDYDSESSWASAFAFGAKAILFVEPVWPAYAGRIHLNLPANLPRFWISRGLAEQLGILSAPRKVKILAAARWESLQGRNVVAVVRANESSLKSKAPREALLLAANIDSYSDVPLLAPGARDAANTAALIEFARAAAKSHPQRDLIFCFLDGQTQANAGIRALYTGIYRQLRQKEIAEGSLEDRLQAFQNEEKYVSRIAANLRNSQIIDEKGRLAKLDAGTQQILREETRRISSEVLDALRITRLNRNNQKKSIGNSESKVPDPKILILEEKIARLEEQDLGWNSLLRDLDRRVIDEATRPYFDKIRKAAQTLCAERLAEIAKAKKQTEASRVLRDAIGPDKNNILLHIHVNFGDASNQWSFIHGDDSDYLGIADAPGVYGNVHKAVQALADATPRQWPNFDNRPVSQKLDSRLFAPGTFADSTSIARHFGIMNLSLMTIADPLLRQGQPNDTIQSLKAQAIAAQAQQAAPMILAMAASPDLSLASPIAPIAVMDETKWNRDRATGPSVREGSSGSGLRAQNVRGAIICLYRGATWDSAAGAFSPRGYSPDYRVMSDLNGFFEIGPYSTQRYNRQLLLFAATFEGASSLSVDGVQPALAQFSSAEISSVITAASARKLLTAGRLQDQPIDLCRARGKTFVGFGYDRTMIQSLAMRALSTSEFPQDRHLAVEAGNVLTLFAPLDAAGTKIFNKAGMVLLANSLSPEDYQGHGITMGNPYRHELVPALTAQGLQILNDYRLGLLRGNRIAQPSLEALSSMARDIEADTDATRAPSTPENPPTPSFEKNAARLAAAAAFSRRVYTPVMGVMNDLVVAVVLLLLLTIPFAFALERLLIGTPHIYRQIAWFAAFFIASFALLYFANPAFRLASTPIIIFLAFTIILLSALVIFIMMRKLQAEMRKLQGLAGSSHGADVSRLSTTMAAVKMGISTMRRRPLRTFLTASTVVLLTFTILTFASFGSTWGVKKTYEGPLNANPHVLIRHQIWNPIHEEIYAVLRGYLRDRAEVTARYWVSPTPSQQSNAQSSGVSADKMIFTDDLREAAPLSALVGIDPADLRRDARLRAMLQANGEPVDSDQAIYLSETIAASLKLAPQDVGTKRLLVRGLPLVFAGTFKGSLDGHRQLDGSKMLPVDYESSSGGDLAGLIIQQRQAAALDSADSGAAQFITYGSDVVGLVSSIAARKMGGRIHSISIHPLGEQNLSEIADEAATITALPTYVGDQGGISRYFFTTLVEASGASDLLIPVLLGGLIVFATMLGSVSDREREIYTFSSLGLGPAHVASLFLAEAAVYAVLGGMGGYLLGQVVSRLLGWIAAAMGFIPPSMNFGSVNAIVTILIVVVTVLLSAVYPAIKASRSANPGIQRSWRVPQAKGDLLQLVFPFTVSAFDITGIVSFIEEHFKNYSEPGLGVFASSDTRICHLVRNASESPQPGDDNSFALQANVALAPFDLGIEQKFEMINTPSDIEGVDEVRVSIRRIAGAESDWNRSVKVFIDDLRRQFLIWRSLSREAVEHYREKTLSRWESMPCVQLPPEEAESNFEPTPATEGKLHNG